MSFKLLISGIIFALSMIGCGSTTPGDAASQGGHYKQAAELYVQGANRGDSLASYKMSLLLIEKKISVLDYGHSIKWSIMSCTQGNVLGCHNSAHAYEYGNEGARKDYLKAQKYYTMAAEKGFIKSQYNLGSLYSNRYLNNDVEGYKWMLIALKNADTDSIGAWIKKDPPAHRQKLFNRMSGKQKRDAQKKADTWVPKT